MLSLSIACSVNDELFHCTMINGKEFSCGRLTSHDHLPQCDHSLITK